MQKYDFELEYSPGKTMLVSDTSSQSYLNDIESDIQHVHFILFNLLINQSRLDQFLLESQKEQILQTLICYNINDWPEKHQLPKELFPYYSHYCEIMYHEGYQRIVPTTLRSEIEDIIKNCPACLTFRNRQRSEPTVKHPVPQEPWIKLAPDLF